MARENVSIFYFSGTGNTWWVAEKLKEIFISSGFETITYSIEKRDVDWDEIISQVLDKSRYIGFGFPVYSSTIPEIMKDWTERYVLKHAKERDSLPHAFVYDTMAKFSGDTPLKMRKLLKKSGFIVKQAINIRTLSNLPQMRKLMVWDKEEQQQIFLKAEEKCKRLVECIKTGNSWLMRRDPGSKFVAWFQRTGWNLEGKRFRSLFEFDTELCNRCGLCVKFCPVNNLSFEETEGQKIVKYGEDCVVCMRCFNYCPQNAIFVMKRTRDVKKYPRFRGQVPGFKLSKVKK
ncbi:MAG: EFR1 family ferrodoxin [Promethearchaeota archaeon]